MRFELFCRFVLSVLVFGATVVCLSCGEHDKYEIVMAPADVGLDRQLTAWRHVGSGEGGKPNEVQIAPKMLQALADAYPRRVTTQPGAPRQTFAGRFAGKLPGELGGAGEYRIINTPMGSVAGYVERFAGLDDLTSQLAQINASADIIADVFGGWLASRLETRPGFENLRRFMDKDFRKDIKNLTIYLWSSTSGLVTSETNIEEIRARLVLYVIEHGYIELADALNIYRLVADDEISHQDKAKAGMFYVRKFVAAKMGADANDPHLAFLSDPNEVAKSFQAYVETTDVHRRILEQWKEQGASHPADSEDGNASTQPADGAFPTEPWNAFAAAYETLGQNWIHGLGLFGPTEDQVDVTLKLPGEPLVSNGQWYEKSRGLSWSFNYRGRPLSHICYAAWVAENAEFQKTHFGHVVLEGLELASFCAWHETLTRSEARRWDEFLQTVRPATAERQLRRFVETHELPAGPATQPSAEAPGRRSPTTEPTTQQSGGQLWISRGAEMILDALPCSGSTQPAETQPVTTPQ